MNKLQKGALIAFVTFAASTLINYTPAAFASGVPAHVRIVGTNRTIWFGDVTTNGCNVTDKTGIQHTFTQPVAVCALDAAAKTGNFTYVMKDFGGSLGLFLEGIAEDASASDFSTYWLYDINGKAASIGATNYVVNNGDSLYFHFENPNADANQRAINDGMSYLRSQQDASGQISGFSGVSGWAAMAFAAGGVNPAMVQNGGPTLVDYLSTNAPTTSSSATDWERGILAITAASANPYDFGGIDYVSKLETYHNNSQLGGVTQVNDDIFGLLALVSAGSGASAQTKQDSLNFILSHQNPEGGFSWSTTGTSDVDDTAAALQALAAAQNAGMSVPTSLSTAIVNAKNFVLGAKNSDGGFPYTKGDSSNASTTAWVVMAMSAIGEDTASAKAYIRNSQEENGSFKWQSSSVGETFTTSYAVLALTGKFWPVRVFVGTTPVPTQTPVPTAIPTNSPTPTPTVIATSTPTPSATSSKGIIRLQRDKMLQMKKEQKRVMQGIREQIREELKKLSELIKGLRKR